MARTKKRDRTVDVKCTIPDTRPWFKGDPPAVGWYEASVQRKANLYRWWDGKHWSVFATRDLDAVQAAARARLTFFVHPADTMYWREIKV